MLRYEEDPAELKTEDQTLDLYYVRYEVPLQECLVARLPAGEIEIGWGFVRSAEWELAICENSCSIQLLNASAIEWVDLANIELHQLADSLRIFGNDFLTAESLQQTHLEFQKIADTYVREWMEKSPRVLTCRQEMTDFCWWVLGANQIALKIGENATMRTIVVPSMLGYVGLWQWDAYFIALGLQHGDIELAIAQLEIAFSPEPDGQLPDVVHEKGRLASSLDLPHVIWFPCVNEGICATEK
ncbi:MGH1-like glycoside hydrolase domain-containing protein [Arcanobacterium hippocoleae]|uniref:MGH1-like glycoside hydrolase domain-containing protein n=1 Tax=Arcanobacterium hippocoleae TaxID=149017 RepID=UPI003342DE44